MHYKRLAAGGGGTCKHGSRCRHLHAQSLPIKVTCHLCLLARHAGSHLSSLSSFIHPIIIIISFSLVFSTRGFPACASHKASSVVEEATGAYQGDQHVWALKVKGGYEPLDVIAQTEVSMGGP